MKKQTSLKVHLVRPKKRRKGVHSKNNKAPKKYRGQGR